MKKMGMKFLGFSHEELQTQQKHIGMCKRWVELQLICVCDLIQLSTVVLHKVLWTKKCLKQKLQITYKNFIKKIKFSIFLSKQENA